jgi:Ni,Fe-hydrogenase III component G
MEESLSVQAELLKKFPNVLINLRVPRARRIFAQVSYERFAEVFEHAVGPMGFSMLCAVTGLDGGATMEVIYHLARPSGVTFNLGASVPKDRPVIKTITGRFPAAELYERELVDLLGFQVEGLSSGQRYPLPDNWPADQYPLRKDWKPVDLPGLAASEESHAQ